MYVHLIFAYIIATFFSTNGSSIANKSVYEMIKYSAGDANFKCPYVRATKLLAEPDFLLKCVNVQQAQSLTALSPDTVQDGLCLLYYDNFEHLCYVSNNYTDVAGKFLSSDEIDQTLATYQNNISQVCAVLKNITHFLNDSKRGIETVGKHLETNDKCLRICTDFDLNVKPLCSMTALIVNATKRISKESQNALLPNRNENAKIKPSVIDHNADTQDVSAKKQNEEVSNSQNTVAAGQLSLDTLKNAPLERASETQISTTEKNLPDPSLLQQNVAANSHAKNSFVERWDKFIPQEQHSTNVEESSTVKIPSTSSGSASNIQDKKLEGQKVDQEAPIPSQPTSATLQKKIATVELDTKIVEKAEANNNLKTNNADKKKSEKLATVLGEDGGTKAETKIGGSLGVKTNLAETSKDDEIQPPLNNLPPNVEDVNEFEIPDEQSKLSTKVDGVEAAGEAPQEVIEQLDEDEEDEYNTVNEEQPKFSEVKNKLLEKSKPREIDEDGPSFAANYQNQSIDDSDSYFFSYFMMVCIIFICGYVAYHNKQKILALVVEGRKSRRPSRTRRPNSANYRKLDSNLEEAVTSSCNKNATQVIY